ncbi:hypothetical protein DYBT9623_01293 [Dyadobacter sp. CECT 9623]|uniref:ABC-2 type transport system permease protein n=1 Tax=Dyadobacter linearis TaxID=2823330 RepID=A0ABN7R9T4_9BACT|nr:DUF3526 domain-containing protein [Dyadobacter sp. CECT 9623]CAG5068562.1 hypothetical protein DYBT9623_01293 [Dyadobacter sp. CECT 9623]
MFKLAFKNFLSSSGVKIGIAFLIITGLVSLIVGNQFLAKQAENVEATAAYQKAHISKNVQYHPDELGLLLYYVKFSLVNQTERINSLSIGQRDVNPSIQSVTIRGLEGQKYDADLQNPSNLLLGNIDFSFVLIYLFPLFIIAFTYNIISEERESGTWKIAAVQSSNLFGLILKLFTVRFLVVVFTLFLTLFLATTFLKIPLNTRFWLFSGVSFLYILFWFALSFWVASMSKSSSYNAVTLLSAWILLIIVLPAMVNSYLVSAYPVPEAMETTVKQRNGYHEKWDMDKKATIDKFYTHYPQFKTFGYPKEDFNWLWYYAMQQMGDDEAAGESKALREKLAMRNRASTRIASFIPSVHMQIQLNEIAGSGLSNQLRFMDETGRFHEQLRLQFYPAIFKESPASSQQWEKFEIENFSDNNMTSATSAALPLVVAILLFSVLGWVRFRTMVS